MKKERKLIIERLECLVHKRLTRQDLKIALCNIFNVSDIKLKINTELDSADYSYIFAITKPYIGGVFDIYYLPTREKENNLCKNYITEVGYVFDM